MKVHTNATRKQGGSGHLVAVSARLNSLSSNNPAAARQDCKDTGLVSGLVYRGRNKGG